MGAQEHPPGSVVPRWRRDAVGAQDLADSGGSYPVPEPAKLALDPDHTPPGVLPGQAHDQRGEFVRYRRASRWPGLAPLGRNQAAVPAQQRAGRHDPPGPQALGHDPGQRGKDRPVSPGHPRSGVWSGAARPPRAAARVSPRPWTMRTGTAARARTTCCDYRARGCVRRGLPGRFDVPVVVGDLL